MAVVLPENRLQRFWYLPDDVNEGDTVKVELDKQQISANGKTYKIPAIPENLYHIIMDGGLVKSIMKKVEKGLL